VARCRLLIVDDEVELLVLLVREARERGYDATGTIDPSEVLDIVRSRSPSVVLLDLHMPRIDGRDLLAKLTRHPVTPAVIILTGAIDDFTCELCRSYGAVDIVRKPFDPDDLFRRIDAAAKLVGAMGVR